MRNFRGVVWRPRRTCRHGTTATGQTPEGETSIFERMVRPKVPKVQAHSEESLELFSKLASPEDVPRQFVAAAQSGVKDFQAWQALSRTAVQSLRHFKVSHIGSILQSCAQMHWRDEHLLCGLTEAFRCACELRRGSVRDYSVILQALRRLNYCPWVGALRPIIADLRWRLRKHRWRPLDLVLALRFVAGFQVQHLPQVRAEGLALCRELRIRAEQRMGEMRHLELAHFARALVVLNQSGLPDSLLLERLADNFSRRAGELPLGALLHMCSTLLTAKADAPSEFRAVLVEKAQAELAYLKPFQIALLASTAAHFRLRDPKLLIRLGQSVGSNLDTFNLHQVGMVAEAFAVVGHHHRSLVGYIEQILLKESNSDAGLSRPKLLATFVIAAAQQENFAQRSQHLADFVQELTMALENYEAPIDELPTRPRSLPRKSRRRVSANSLLQAPIPPTPEQPTESDVPRGRKSRQKMNSEENFASESILREAPELSSRLQNLPSMPIATQQLADLEAIAFSLGTAGQTSETAPMETSVEAPAAAMGGEIIPGVGFVSGRARRSFNKTALEVNSFAPSGSSVIRAGLRRFPPRSTRNIQQILGARGRLSSRALSRSTRAVGGRRSLQR